MLDITREMLKGMEIYLAMPFVHVMVSAATPCHFMQMHWLGNKMGPQKWNAAKMEPCILTGKSDEVDIRKPGALI